MPLSVRTRQSLPSVPPAALADAPARRRLSAPAYFACVFGVTLLALALYKPQLLRAVQEAFGIVKPLTAVPESFYTVRVAPLLQEHCSGCHGEARQKGKLRVDSYAALMRGGRSGAVVHAGNAQQSELIRRVMLPPSDDRAMPPAGRRALTADEITVLKLWVAAGASGVQLVEAIKGAPQVVPEIKIAQIDEAATRRERAPLEPIVAQLQAKFPGVISYESRGSADLYVNASVQAAAFGEPQLQALTPLRERIVWADFSGTSLTDASIPTLTSMQRLRVLRLSNTKVTERLLQAVAGMKELKSIALVGTAVPKESIAALRAQGIKVYDGTS